MRGRKRRESRRAIISDRKINKKNKYLMIDKILSYNPALLEGIEVYKDANKNFMLLICLGALLINFPLISVPCCVLSMYFIVKMLQYIRYKSINNIVNVLAKDLSFKGIYDKEKIEDMLDDFKTKYGEDIFEYSELVNMVEKYETFVTRIEYILKGASFNKKRNIYSKDIINSNKMSYIDNESKLTYREVKEKQYKNIEINGFKDYDENLSILYKDENGEIKIVNKAIEFFENKDNEICNNENAIMLKNVNKENENLTIYLYKKSSILQKNAL
ncbi:MULTISPECIES: hypothetical protein [unclassified Clostridium]|uniref:hypothetical protein n=1 Tax=unclassified Clostridium TaxID=2614128 RepID=UPI0002982620|nr:MULTISPECIES: hypothetical protein [unclassified Clostridium]EKQ56929.1 MAG: hypothetical protein A370_01425 [Clostridium sp. Maddingley MBC34-26]